MAARRRSLVEAGADVALLVSQKRRHLCGHSCIQGMATSVYIPGDAE